MEIRYADMRNRLLFINVNISFQCTLLAGRHIAGGNPELQAKNLSCPAQHLCTNESGQVKWYTCVAKIYM